MIPSFVLWIDLETVWHNGPHIPFSTKRDQGFLEEIADYRYVVGNVLVDPRVSKGAFVISQSWYQVEEAPGGQRWENFNNVKYSNCNGLKHVKCVQVHEFLKGLKK